MPLQPSRPRRTPRPRVEARRSLAGAAAALLVAAVLGACGSTATRPPAREPVPPPAVQEPFATAEQAYLIDPLTGFQEVDAERAERVRAAHRALLAASDRERALATAEELLGADPGFHPAQVLIAQVDLGDGNAAKVVSRLLPVSDALPQYTAAQLLLGRAAELTGDVPLAYAAFREIAARNPRAFQRAGELHPRAVEIVTNRLNEALRQSRLDEAATQLVLLRRWAPSETGTLEGARALAVARGDLSGELAAVKELSSRRPGERALLERQAELEMAVGDPGAGLQIIQTLAEQAPKDPVLAEKLEAAKFRWRVSLLPKHVQDVAAKPDLTKADLAVLLYWLVPNVRYGRPTTGRIATDVLEHRHQEEIVRVVNLGLMEVDPTLHRFSPSAAARRGTVIRSLTLALARFGEKLSCQPGQGGSCEAAARCGVLAQGEECRTGASISGGEAVELIRRALKLLGRS